MESDEYSKRIPTIETLKKQYIDLKNTSDLNTNEWCEYVLEESNRIRDKIDEEDGEFEGEMYTLPKFNLIPNYLYYSKDLILTLSYNIYRKGIIKIIQNREKYDKDEAEKEEREEREIQFKKSIISKFVSMYNITDEESEAIILYISSKAPKNIRKKYKDFNKDTLKALKFINRYSTEQSIRFEDTVTVLLEHI